MSARIQQPTWKAFQLTAEELEAELSNQVYSVSVDIFEHAVCRKILHGNNGHHMAQQLAREAVRIWKEHLDEKK